MDAHRDNPFDMKTSGFCGVLGLGLVEHLGSAAGCRCGWSSWMGHRGLNDLSEVHWASDFAGRIERTRTAGDSEFDSLDGDSAVTMHVLAGG